MKISELQQIINFANSNYFQGTHGLKLADMNRALNNGEMIAIAYYKAVVQHLIKNGKLNNSKDLDIMFVEEDSEPPEDDYL